LLFVALLKLSQLFLDDIDISFIYSLLNLNSPELLLYLILYGFNLLSHVLYFLFHDLLTPFVDLLLLPFF